MSDYDYSQRGEQAIILDALRPGGLTRAETENRRFLDIGAYDGLRFSNTRYLARIGWGGVCVEPAAWAFDRLALLYHDRPDIVLVQALIDGRGDWLAPVHYAAADALTTTEDDHAELWAEAGAHFRQVYVPPLHVAKLITSFPGPYRLISIDTERTSVAVLKGLLAVNRSLQHLGCDVLCIEHDDKRDEVAALCDGYEVVFENGENLILRRGSK